MEAMLMEKIGFIHGRFQLFHNDHLKYALAAKEQCEKLIVGITSPENTYLIHEVVDPHRSISAANPFSYFERYNMIRLALIEAGIKETEFDIVPFPIERPEILSNYIPLCATSFFTIYDQWGYEKLNRLKSLGYKTIVIHDDKEKMMCSTDIRQLIIDEKEWRELVPHAVYSYIIENNLIFKVKQAVL